MIDPGASPRDGRDDGPPDEPVDGSHVAPGIRDGAATGRRAAWRWLGYVVSVVAALGATGILLGGLGYGLGESYSTMLLTSFRTSFGFVETLNKWVPLTLQALAFTIPLTTGKFNIGGEGQLLMGAVGAVAVGILFPGVPGLLLVPLVLLAGVVLGAAWAGIAAWLLHRFGINEILSTVLLNFVAIGVVEYVAGEVWSDVAAGHPTTIPIAEAAELPRIWASPPLHAGVVVALLVLVAVTVHTRDSSGGYELRAVGSNPRAAAVHGIDVRRAVAGSLVLGGVVGGLSGAIEVAGVHERLTEGIQSNFLLLGIIIGLIARGRPVLVPFVAFFIAILEVGASALQRTVGAPSEIVWIVEALVLLFVLLSEVVGARVGRLRWAR